MKASDFNHDLQLAWRDITMESNETPIIIQSILRHTLFVDQRLQTLEGLLQSVSSTSYTSPSVCICKVVCPTD